MYRRVRDRAWLLAVLLEGVYVCIACRGKGGDLEPCLTKVKLMLGQNLPSRSALPFVQEPGEQLRNHHVATPKIVLGGGQ